MIRPGSAIEVAGLTKSFTIFTQRSTSLKELVLGGLTSRGETRRLEVLRDLNFTVGWGHSLAIVGSNGCGKSTLLKLLLGVTPADGGTIRLGGPLAGLVELGVGFQMELTGMENIFLQGSLMGLSRRQILDRLERILDFSGLDTFIHTPLKRYSSGMMARLGFALAVNSDAEILLVDEVLSVGDKSFQTKCLQKMSQLRREGRTILFVTHAREQIELVADEVLWLEEGRIRARGPVDEVLPQYLGKREQPSVTIAKSEGMTTRDASALSSARTFTERPLIQAVRFLNDAGVECLSFASNEAVVIEVEVESPEPLGPHDLLVTFASAGELRMSWTAASLSGVTLEGTRERTLLRGRFPALPFAPGRYEATVSLEDLTRPGTYPDLMLNAFEIQLRGEPTTGSGAVLRPVGRFAP